MNDSEIRISRGTAVAGIAWSVALALLAVMWITGDELDGITALAVLAVAAVATIRTYFVRHDRLMRAAFELGRDAGNASAPTLVR